MSATTRDLPGTGGAPHPGLTGYRLTASALLRSEWLKLWSLRSTAVALAATAVGIVGLSAAGAALTVWSAGGGALTGPRDVTGTAMTTSVLGADLAVLVVAVLGALAATGEHATGTIRTSVAASPRRLLLLGAKAAAVAAAVVTTAGPALLAAFAVGQALYAPHGASLSLGDPGVLRVLLGHVVVLAGVAVAGVGVGALVRSTPGAVCTLLALLLVVPVALLALPSFPGDGLVTAHHFAASSTALTSTEPAGALEALAAALPFLGWVAALLALGGLALQRRDL